MKLSELIEEFIDMKLEGEPESSDWISIDEHSARRGLYWKRLGELREEIDAVIAAHKEKNK